jgi:hypothetical protein
MACDQHLLPRCMCIKDATLSTLLEQTLDAEGMHGARLSMPYCMHIPACVSTSFTRRALSLVSARSTVLMPNSAETPAVTSPDPGTTRRSPEQARHRHVRRQPLAIRVWCHAVSGGASRELLHALYVTPRANMLGIHN